MSDPPCGSPRIQRALIALIVVGNAALWAVPSSVVKLVARERDVLLGRYSVERMTLMLALLVVSAVIFFLLAAPLERRKRRCFAVCAAVLGTALAYGVVEVAAQLMADRTYVLDRGLRHRPPGRIWQDTYEDVAPCARSYADAVRGYPSVSWTFRTDARGYRNAQALEQADIVVLGDSFAEGTKVTDAEVWPAALAALSGSSVYNLGMSGANPPGYLASLERQGQALQPKRVLCMIYEGNDFRGKASLEITRTRRVFQSSPILRALKGAMIAGLGPINADGDFAGMQAVAWMPMVVGGKPYAFPPKRAIELYMSKEERIASPGFAGVTMMLDALAERCRKIGADLLVLYAPSKPHVLLPLAGDALPTEALRDFLLLQRKKLIRSRRELPPAAAMRAELLALIGSSEQAVAEYCAKQKVPFFSLTPALRDATAGGEQAYYTYDQHWTPLGNRRVAEAVARTLEARRRGR